MSTSSQNDTTEPGLFISISIIFFIFALLPSTWIVKDSIFWYKMRESISKIGIITKLDIKIEHTSGGGRGGGGGITKTVLVV